MAEENNEGVAYLMALKRSAVPDAIEVAPERELDPEPAAGIEQAMASPTSQPQYKGAEKRRSPRYPCEGSAQMRELNCDVHTWATFTDISMHGCYVEAQATYPVGTDLHMRLEANGFRVETPGKVRVSYPYLGMGIAFVEMSEENRTRLKELLASIVRPHVIMGPGIASTLPAFNAPEVIPAITNAQAAVDALIAFFGDRQMLMREDFIRLLRQSQDGKKK
jgi:hypothetical protein